MNAVYTFPPYFPNIHSNVIFPSTPSSLSISINVTNILF
jgi:hypothetical protein